MSKKYPHVSVQVINWNGKKFLKGCFDSLLKQDYSNFEAVLVDNGSSDESLNFMQENYPIQIKNGKIKIFTFQKNYGFAGGYNRSYKRTKADYVLLLNNDTLLPDSKLISKMVRTAESNPEAACVGAAIYPFGTDIKKAKKQSPGALSLALTNTLTPVKDNRVFYTSGCCCLIKKKLIDVPFDEDYFAYSEDVYLGWKTNLQGYKNIFEPEAKILHYGSGTSGSGSPFVRYYGERNRILNCLLFYQAKTLIKISPLLLLYFLASGLFFLQRPRVFLAYLKAYGWFLVHPLKVMRKRRVIQNIRKIKDEEILKMLSADIFLTEPKATSFY